MSRIKTNRNVTTIPATISRFTSAPINEQKETQKQLAYARVQQTMRIQATSYRGTN